MLNLKNNENDAVFNEISKKKAKIKIKFQKMNGFLDSIPWLTDMSPTVSDIPNYLKGRKIIRFF